MNEEILQIIRSGNEADFRAWLAKSVDTPDELSPGEPTLAQTAYYQGRRNWAGDLAQRLFQEDFGTACTLGDLHQATRQMQADPSVVNTLSNDGFVPLCLAAAFGHEEMVDLLLSFGAEPNAQSEALGGVHPLDSAIFGKSQSIVHKLLQAGANPNLPQAGGFFPIHGAAQNGNLEVVKDLVAHGARIDVVTDDGKMIPNMARRHAHILEFLATV